MEISLIFLLAPLVGHDLRGANVTQQIGIFQTTNERYRHCLSTDTFWFKVGQVVWSLSIVKVEHFLMLFRKSYIFTQS